MEKPASNKYHIAIVAALPEDYETAKALLDERKPEYSLTHSRATCSLGKVGPHNVVVVGKAEDIFNVSIFVKDTTEELLEAFPSIRAGILIGVDGTTPEGSLAKSGDIVVGFPRDNQPGLIQFDSNETSNSKRISTTFEMSNPSTYIKSVINTLQSPKGRQHWGRYLQAQSSRAELASTMECQPLEQDSSKPNKVLCGKVASSAHLLSDRDLINKIGRDSKIMCFERAAANVKARLPFLTVCGMVNSISSTNSSSSTSLSKFASSISSTSSTESDVSAKHQVRMATVMYTMFVSHQISAAQLEGEHAFANLFQYEPFGLELPGFRLIKLDKGRQSQLACHLVQAYLDESLVFTYEALSYSWGSQNTPHEIMVDGKPLSITESLHEALWHLRHPDKDRVLWVDALCIDQRNIKERGHQVDHMGEIYKKAHSVIIWLGYVSGNGAVKLKTAIDIFKDDLPLHAFRKWSRQDERWQQQWRQIEASIGLYSHKELIDGLQSFMEKPWFSRVWILQEVAKAQHATVECNLGSIPSRIFALLPHSMNVQVSEQCQAVLDIMPGPLKSSSWWDQNRNLCNLMWKFRGCKATDPRDRIYALLGMASDMEDPKEKVEVQPRTKIKADYAKDEQAVIQDFCDYLFGDVCPAYDLLEKKIQDLQTVLPAISMQHLQKKLQDKPKNNSLREFLGRQGFISMIDDQNFLGMMRHGSRIMTQYLDKSESPFHITSDAAMQSLETYPDVLEVILKRPDFIVENKPEFVARAVEYDSEVLGQLLDSSTDPEQLRDDALMEAISIGMPSCQPLLKQCGQSVKITQKMLRKAISCHKDVLQHLLDVAESPVPWTDTLFLKAIPEEPKGIQIINENSQPVLITKEIIDEGLIAGGGEVLELYLENMEHPIELEEGLFLRTIEKAPSMVQCLLKWSNRPLNLTDKVFASAYKAGPEVWEQIFPSWEQDYLRSEDMTIYAVEYGKWSLKRHMEDLRVKLQITDKVIGAAGDEETEEMLMVMWDAEKNVSEDAAIRAIETGPKAFYALYNERGLNFKVTERILRAATGQDFIMEVLRRGRKSEVDALHLARARNMATGEGNTMETW